MHIEIFPSGPFATNAYLAACSKSREALIIDPGVGSEQALSKAIEKGHFLPKAILLTHSHWDHTAGVWHLKEKYGIEVMIHRDDEENLVNPGADGLPLWIPIKGVKPDRNLKEGDIVKVGEHSLRVLHTPGHSPGGICLYCEEEKILFSGDTLFKRSIGNLSFPTAEPDKMWESLKKLEKLPPQTTVYPGHGAKTTIGEESWLPRAKELFSSSY